MLLMIMVSIKVFARLIAPWTMSTKLHSLHAMDCTIIMCECTMYTVMYIILYVMTACEMMSYILAHGQMKTCMTNTSIKLTHSLTENISHVFIWSWASMTS